MQRREPQALDCGRSWRFSPGEWGQEPYCSRALVLRAGSSGRKFLYSSTSFSMDSSWLCSLFRSPGSVSRMWLVSCWAGVAGKEKVKTKVTSLNAHRPGHGDGGRPGGCVDAGRHGAEEDQPEAVEHRFSTFLTLPPFNAVPPTVVIPTIRLFLLLHHNCNFATVMNRNVNI